FRQLADPLKQRFPAGGCATRAVDEQNDGGDLLVVGELLQELELVAVLYDEALKANPRNLLTAGKAHAVGGGDHDKPKGEQRGDHCKPTPQRQAPAQPTPIKHGLGFERHGSSSLGVFKPRAQLSPTSSAHATPTRRPRDAHATGGTRCPTPRSLGTWGLPPG